MTLRPHPRARRHEIGPASVGRPYAVFADPRAEFAGRGVCATNAAINAVVLTRTEGDPPATELLISQESLS